MGILAFDVDSLVDSQSWNLVPNLAKWCVFNHDSIKIGGFGKKVVELEKIQIMCTACEEQIRKSQLVRSQLAFELRSEIQKWVDTRPNWRSVVGPEWNGPVLEVIQWKFIHV
ncbi:hypothetical protein NHQ30_008969 [Ciborinia camelliae]|nr:hypothetical protein NHQ30_008969 [Ciborinia camelliae]